MRRFVETLRDSCCDVQIPGQAPGGSHANCFPRLTTRNASARQTEESMATSITTRRGLEPEPPRRRAADQQAPGYRICERRWRSASFFLVERRKGKRWMYGSIA